VADDVSVVIQQEAARGDITTNSVGYAYSFDTRRGGIDPVTNFVFRFGQEFGFGDTQFVRTTALAAVETRILSEVAGIALFWNTPVGPLRFNFTEALSAEDRDETRAFDVTISTQF